MYLFCTENDIRASLLIDNMSLFKKLSEHLNENEIKEFNEGVYKSNKNDQEYWNFMLNKSVIESKVILDNLDNIDTLTLIKKQVLADDVLDDDNFCSIVKNKKLINKLFKYQNLSLEYIKNNINDETNWDNLCQYQNLSIEFMEEHIDKINWELVSEFQLLTIQFIAKYVDKIDWEVIGHNLKTKYLYNDSFIKLFADKPIWNCMIWSENVSDKFFLENINKLNNEELNDALKYKKLNKQLFDSILEKFGDDISAEMINSIIEGQEIDKTFINKYLKKIDFDNLVLHQKLDYKFINSNRSMISLKNLTYNDHFDEELMLDLYPNRHQYKDMFDWDYISEHLKLSKETIKIVKELNKELLIMNELFQQEES